MADPTAETVDLLQQLIRNRCENDGTPESGQEVRNAAVLLDRLESTPLDVETYEPAPGRTSLVARMDGSDPGAPALLLMGHTDVVPADADRWRRDPFGGELVDGEVWGRGAVDMLNLTASMAVAVRRLARSGFRPRGTLIYLAVADEEALGVHGAQWLVEHHRDAVAADYVLTETGGIPFPSPGGVKLPVLVAEKGIQWCRLRVRGTAGHGSQPYRTDNALVLGAEVVRRLAEHEVPAQIHEVWRRFVEGMGYGPELRDALLCPERLRELLPTLPLGMARQFHACTHPMIAPTIVSGGSKINVIPDAVELQLDIRTLPGQSARDVEELLRDALGDLRDRVEIDTEVAVEASASAIDTPLWDTLRRVSARFHPGAATVPYLVVGATDARFLRRLGATAYGYGMFSRKMTFEQFGTMFHGTDERIDVESLGLSVALWEDVCRDLLG
ncbi:M20/M25/M40 family metallo-hydrolase [Pseudonocardia asaccharolytica]|uniref:Peptidase n=1 Tax=Pseudonocardia asaccharolytica DSM 44247 = NBRC 16224 TaxID=1123024 RepID=A0A511D3F3_9PSEU|nr:M20/M25/M40 family metallo-hydrolase [Pseudonocardia asaccharolytica]GEL18124.1 peptidase [Pseudonocardia asaccharolytica DSM 44247 = NBRC 16224]